MSYGFPIERPLPYGAFDIAHGPLNYGSTQIAQFQTRWVAWVGTNGIRFAKYVPGVLFNDTDGQPDDLYPGGTRPAHLSFSFEQDALHAIAIQSGSDTCLVRRKVSGTPTEYSFAGRSPVLFYNGIVEPDTALTDLTVFYIKAAGDKIYVRRQRDNFGIEYQLNPTINCTLRALQKTDARNIGGLNYQLLWGLTTGGRQVFYISGPYPPFPQYASDNMSLDMSFASGIYFPTVIGAFAPGDAAAVDVGFVDGQYITLFQILTAPSDLSSIDLGFDAGAHVLAIVGTASPGDAGSIDGAFDSGTLALIVIGTDSPDDAASIDTGFDSGTYTA